MELRAMQGGLHETQTKGNALAGHMKEVEAGMVWMAFPLFDLILTLHWDVARAPHEAAEDWQEAG